MRTTGEMLDLILGIAKEDDNIRAVVMSGSRANKDCPADKYQDFDIVYFVNKVEPYWENMAWIEDKFGKPSLVQMPESMRFIPPDGDGKAVYLMVFPDGNRIDLTVDVKRYEDTGEPAILLLDKDGDFPKIEIKEDFWYVKKPTQKLFSDCCNEFHWCLNNVAKGIARDELSYVMTMTHLVRDMLIIMLEWYVGVNHDFSVSAGKSGKYFKNLLPADVYEKFRKTYSDAEPEHIWEATFTMLDLFGEVAREVADKLSFVYDEEEEKGIAAYMKWCRQV